MRRKNRRRSRRPQDRRRARLAPQLSGLVQLQAGLALGHALLRFDQVSAQMMREPAQAVGRNDTMAGHDDRKRIVAGGLPDRARFAAQAAREFAVSPRSTA